VTLALDGTPVPQVLGDGRKLQQVLRQLLGNAIKFTPAGGMVTVSWRVGPLWPDDELGGRAATGTELGVRLSVRDTGIGISPEKQAHIFEPFFQVDSSSTREYGGTGLGLTLVKSYVEAHGGHVWVESTLGVGSTFTVSLPTATGAPGG
jgi:signal transduction histidine kinase